MRSAYAFAVLTCLLTTLGGPSLAAAQEDNPNTGSDDHEVGFYARLGLGFGGLYSEFDASDDFELSTAGIGIEGELVAGAKITESLAIHATGFLSSAIDPEFQINNVDAPSDSETVFLFWMAGAGMTYEFSNGIYASGSFGVSQVGIETETPLGDNVDAYSDAGFAALNSVGIEWAISDSLAAGVAANFFMSLNPIDDGELDDTGLTIGGGLAGTISFD
ncbi:MAG: hypothetical protein AAFZ38_04530 [Myxococcota bacterium]